MFDTITIKNARLHNLKNITLSIPKNQLVVFTGLSGSGKSTLALDTLHQESQRQFFESLAWSVHEQADVDRIEGLSPSIAIVKGHQSQPLDRGHGDRISRICVCSRASAIALPQCGADIPPAYDVSSDAVPRRRFGRDVSLPAVRHAGA
jgi:excinuclease ABC subunit A